MADCDKKSTLAEWPTLLLLVVCYLAWLSATTWVSGFNLILGIFFVTLTISLHSSLQHEMLHGHPFRNRKLNELLVFPALGLAIPYHRFRDTHLAHHRNSNLTDPYDDPETNYLDPVVWQGIPNWKKQVLNFNNLLIGRMIVGPAVSQFVFMRADWAAIRAGEKCVLMGWMIHVPCVAIVVWWLISFGQMPVWAYAISAYMGLSLLKIRTYLEHRAHVHTRGRTVIVEDRGPLAILFLNNNLHSVHHSHPSVAWYKLPALFAGARERYLGINDGYYYRSYGEIFRKHLFRRKDGVPHPLWKPKTGDTSHD